MEPYSETTPMSTSPNREIEILQFIALGRTNSEIAGCCTGASVPRPFGHNLVE